MMESEANQQYFTIDFINSVKLTNSEKNLMQLQNDVVEQCDKTLEDERQISIISNELFNQVDDEGKGMITSEQCVNAFGNNMTRSDKQTSLDLNIPKNQTSVDRSSFLALTKKALRVLKDQMIIKGNKLIDQAKFQNDEKERMQKKMESNEAIQKIMSRKDDDTKSKSKMEILNTISQSKIDKSNQIINQSNVTDKSKIETTKTNIANQSKIICLTKTDDKPNQSNNNINNYANDDIDLTDFDQVKMEKVREINAQKDIDELSSIFSSSKGFAEAVSRTISRME